MIPEIRKSITTLLLGESLQARVFSGGAWLGAGSVAEQVVRFGRNMLLARLLAPGAFGTMAIVLSVCAAIQSFTDIGVKEGLIRNPRGSEHQYVVAAWWLAMFRAISIYTFFFLSAPLLSHFYVNPELTGLLRVAALAVLFEGAISTRAYVAIKEMKFLKWAAIQHGGGFLGVLVTVILSFIIRDVWALVIGYCCESMLRCIISYLLCPFVPSWGWNTEAARELIKFSKRLFGLSFLNFLFMRTDIFVLGKLYAPAELGLYAMAIYIVQTPTGFVMNLLGQTLLPAFSEIQDDASRMNRIFSKVTSLILLIGVPMIAFLYFSAKSLLLIVYGPAYSAAAASLLVAGMVCIVNVLNGQITTLFYAKGRPELHRSCVVIMAITMIALVYPLARLLGPVGGQLAALCAVLAGFAFQLVRIRHLTQLNVAPVARVLGLTTLVSLSVLGLCFGFRYFDTSNQAFINLLLGAAGLILAYCLSLAIYVLGGRKGLA